VGDVMFYGRGAGDMPTGSAVVGDIMEEARAIRTGASGCGPCVYFSRTPLVPLEEVVSRFYLRLHVADRPKTLSAVTGALGDEDISIARVAQHEVANGRGEIVV